MNNHQQQPRGAIYDPQQQKLIIAGNGTTLENLIGNDDLTVVDELGGFKILEWKRDMSVNRFTAINEYFSAKMGIRRRQLLVDLASVIETQAIHVQAGAMQFTVGNVQAATNIKGVGDLFSKAVRGAVTGESAIKPEYRGTGMIMLEPTYRYIILIDVFGDFPNGVVLDDGLYLASASTVQQKAIARSNISSAVAGGEGLFNLACSGYGMLALESPVPRSEIITVTLNNDELKIDGNMALAWDASLSFTVERSTKTLIGSAASGEGLVNVYRGTGKVLMSPVATNAPMMDTGSNPA